MFQVPIKSKNVQNLQDRIGDGTLAFCLSHILCRY
jgi:hypothetical protein